MLDRNYLTFNQLDNDLRSKSPLTKFTCFPRLPLELRHQIVRTSARDTPIVAAEIGVINGKNGGRGSPLLVPIRASTPLLGVSREVRDETLKVLIRHHKPQVGEPTLFFNEHRGIFWCINFDDMTFSRNFGALIPDSHDGRIPKIRTLATGWEIWPQLLSRGGKDFGFMSMLKNMHNIGIEEVLIITKPVAKFSTPWFYGDVEFRKAGDFDPANEPVHWKLLRENLAVSAVSLSSIQTAMNKYIEDCRDVFLEMMEQAFADVPQQASDIFKWSPFSPLGDLKDLIVPDFKFVEAYSRTAAKAKPITPCACWQPEPYPNRAERRRV